MGAIAAPQNNTNYQSNSQSTDFQVGPKAVSSDDQTLTLNNDMFGLHDPFSLQAVYSKLFGMTVEGTYTQILGLKDAALLELDLGGKQRRIAGTWGHALTTNQLFKITAENLSQNLDFDFVTGKIRKWMYQNAIGGSYVYLIKNGLFNDINLNAYYSKANSKNLPSIDYTSGSGIFRDFRRIAGGIDKSASVGVHLLPTPATLIGIAADYDNVSYKMRNDLSTKRDENGLGATVSLDQLINDHIKFNLLASHRKPYQDYKAEVDWLVNSTPGSSLELGVLGERVIGNLGTRNDTQGGVNFAYTWGGNPTAKPMLYGVPKADTGISGLRDWVSNPAVRMEQVLALKDERIQRIGTITTPSPKLASNNEDAIKIHPGETKQIDVTQYFASHSDNKNASKIVYTVKTLPKGHDLKYQDGKLIINQDSFTKKDLDQKFVINFIPANTNAIPSLSMLSLVLAVKNGPATPYPNPKYYNSGKGITKDLHAGVAYDHESPIAEEQTIDNQLMINPAPDVPNNDLKIYFKSDEVKKLNDLGLTLNVDPKPRPKINHYFIITFSGTPKSNVGPHTFHLYAFSKYGSETTTPLPITLNILSSGPAISWKDQTPNYNVGDKPNEEIADASASPDHKLTDITITPDGDEGHKLSDYHLTADITGKGTPQATVTLTSTDGVVLPDQKAKTQHYKLTVTDNNTNKSVSEDFVLTVNSNASPIVTINKPSLVEKAYRPVAEIDFATANAGLKQKFKDTSQGEDKTFQIKGITNNGQAYDLAHFGLRAVINPKGDQPQTDFTDAIIAIVGSKDQGWAVNAKDAPEGNPVKFRVIARNETQKSSSADFTLAISAIVYSACPSPAAMAMGYDYSSMYIKNVVVSNIADQFNYNSKKHIRLPDPAKDIPKYYVSWAIYQDTPAPREILCIYDSPDGYPEITMRAFLDRNLNQFTFLKPDHGFKKTCTAGIDRCRFKYEEND
jgi:hypothetical protein